MSLTSGFWGSTRLGRIVAIFGFFFSVNFPVSQALQLTAPGRLVRVDSTLVAEIFVPPFLLGNASISPSENLPSSHFGQNTSFSTP